MKVVLQRVTNAAVTVDGAVVGAIGPGLCAFVAVERGDDEAVFAWMTRKLLGTRLFSDADGRLNLSLVEAGAELLLVSNFTVAGQVKKGTRPDFGRCAPAAEAEVGFNRLHDLLRAELGDVPSGQFGANMQVTVNNDGPVTMSFEKQGEPI